MILAIDPGLRGCGVAFFEEGPGAAGQLIEASYVDGSAHAERSQAWLSMVEGVKNLVGDRKVSQLVIELPQVYVTARSKGDHNDLIHLAAVVGGLCEAFHWAQQRVYLPAEWKGQTPKHIMCERALKRLSAEEACRVSCRKKALLHNVVDALAMGLVFLGRM